MSKVFVDTNILVYCLDNHDQDKQTQARGLLQDLAGKRQGVLSTQVLQEFYVAATTRLNADPLTVKTVVHSFAHFETVLITPELINEAIDCSILNRLSFWDALIVAAAEQARCGTLWTGDLNPGQVIRGMRIEDPFQL